MHFKPVTAKRASRAAQEQMYRAYMTFFEIAERQRRWRLEDDIPWDSLHSETVDEETAVCVETFCGVELYVPDYTANGLIVNRELFGHAWFQACWGYEESKHALVFREYLTRSGLRTTEQYLDYEDKIVSKTWTLPYATRRQMICYGALQEAATYLIYQSQKQKHRELGNPALERIFFLVARDEAAHAGFYRNMLKLELDADREGTIGDLGCVAFDFRMPGVALIPDYLERLKVDGVGISPQKFLRDAVFPLLRFIGTNRAELFRATRRQRLVEPERDFQQEAEAIERNRRHEAALEIRAQRASGGVQ